MHFSEQIIEQIKNKIIISDIISKKVKLQRKGNHFSGLCPFHHEKTPSFTVSDERQNYHCFGCGAHGDVISFITNTTGMSFVETLEQLAPQAGIVVSKEYNNDHHHNLYRLMDLATKWFQLQLKSAKNKHALTYLINRKLSNDIIEKFSLGFAANEKNALMNYLIAQGASHSELLDVGLIIRSESGEYFDRFKNRIMFPIMNISGKVIAFGGRSMDSNLQPKYLNSPETILFKKREILFAENLSRQASYKNKRIILVEGYMDVISMHNAGFTETVASLGTAISKDHIEKLWKYANKPIICLDGDDAGARAAGKLALEVLTMIKGDYSLEFIKLPPGLDPDELVSNQAKEVMDKLISSKKTLSEYIWLSEFAILPNNPSAEQKSSLEKRLYNIASSIQDKTISSAYRSFFSEQLWNNVKKHKNQSLLKNKKSIISSLAYVANCIVPELEKIERTLMVIIINHPQLLCNHVIEEDFSMIEFSDNDLDSLRSKILTIYFDNNDISKQDLDSALENDGIFTNINKWASFNMPYIGDDGESIWEYSLIKYRVFILEQEYKISLGELTENSDIKAQEIRKQIMSQRNNMLHLEQLIDN
jgi:DNA primase